MPNALILLLFLVAIILTGCGTTQHLPMAPVTQHAYTTRPTGQANNAPAPMSRLTLENILVYGFNIDVVLTHGNMVTTISNPYISQTDPQQFIVTLKNVAPGKYVTNRRILFNTGLASDLDILPNGDGLKLVFTLRQKVTGFQSGIAGGDMIGFQFSL